MKTPVLAISHATVRYASSDVERWHLYIPEFSLSTADLYLLSGDNMSGKSTFLRFAGGLGGDLVVTGDVQADGEMVPSSSDLADLSVVLSSDDKMFPELSIFENIAVGMAAGDRRDNLVALVEKLLSDAGVFNDRSLTTPLAALSSGGRAIVKFCRALVSKRSLVLMDEISSFLDVARSQLVLSAAIDLARNDRALIVVSHSERDRRFVAEHYAVRYAHISRHLDHSVLGLAENPIG